MKTGLKIWLIRVCTSTLFIITLLITLPHNSSLHPRDGILKEIAPVTIYHPSLSAEEYCHRTLGENFGIAPCTTIDPKFFETNNLETTNLAIKELHDSIVSYKDLLSVLISYPISNGQLLELQAIVERKLGQLESISKVSNQNSYPKIFKGLLIAQGVSYNPGNNKFKTLPQNIAQLIVNQNSIQTQLSSLEFSANNLWLLYVLTFFFSLVLIYRKLSSPGLLFIAIYLSAMFIGLSLIRDASLHYGFESIAFDLSPFRQLYQRQIIVTLISIFLVLFCIQNASRIANLFNLFLTRISITTTTLVCIFGVAGSYLALGPAIGSEFFKASSCFIAAFLLYRYGRTLELAQEQFGLKSLLHKSLSYLSITSVLAKKSIGEEVDLGKYYVAFLFWKIFVQLLLIATLLFVVSALFHDLGGSLIAGLIFFFCLYVLLGEIFASILIALFAAVGIIIYLVSEKVQNRIELMLEPMRANISDFGRLIQFENAGQPFGFELGLIKWCSSDGVCIPLQTLSDYMPTLINGAFGKVYGLFLLGGLALFWILLAYKGFMVSWLYKEDAKFAKLLGSLLCLAALFQLFVTTLGNLRIIPLTGLGTPLLSIGISSSISASLGIGLIVGLCYARK